MSAACTTRIAAYAICLDDAGRILLCRIGPNDLEVGMWTLPGGGLDFGEDPAACMIRELEEEAGLTGQVERLVSIDSRVYPPRVGRDGELHSIRILYRVAITGGALRDEVGGSTDTCAWFTLDEARRLTLVDLGELGIELASDTVAEAG